MGILDLSDLPKPFRIAFAVLALVALIAASAVGAYQGGTTRATEIAEKVSENRDAVIRKDLEDHKKQDDDRFRDVKDRLGRIEDKLDRLIERRR